MLNKFHVYFIYKKCRFHYRMISKRRPELRHKRAIAGNVLYFWERLAKTSKVLETNSAKKKL